MERAQAELLECEHGAVAGCTVGGAQRTFSILCCTCFVVMHLDASPGMCAGHIMQAGYREGMDAGKAQTVQQGFDEGALRMSHGRPHSRLCCSAPALVLAVTLKTIDTKSIWHRGCTRTFSGRVPAGRRRG